MRRIKLKRKASMAPAAAIFYVFLLIMATLLFLITWNYLVTIKSMVATIPPKFEEGIFIYRFVYSPECFIYSDKDAGRANVFTFDSNKFTTAVLNYCYNNEKADKGFKLTLLNSETGEKQGLQTKNFAGSVGGSEVKNIKIYKDGKTYNGRIFIEKNYAH